MSRASANIINGLKRRTDYVGSLFGTLTVTREIRDVIRFGRVQRLVEAHCHNCGKTVKDIIKNIKRSKSCGCLTFQAMSKAAYRHGGSRHTLYGTWHAMRFRCYNPKCKGYKWYGAIGVTIHKTWLNNFAAFYKWSLKNGWRKGAHIDRYPNKYGNYTPTNCRWTTCKKNQNNKRNNILFTYKGQRKTLSEFADIYDCTYPLLWNRINKIGWSIKQAIETPLRYS